MKADDVIILRASLCSALLTLGEAEGKLSATLQWAEKRGVSSHASGALFEQCRRIREVANILAEIPDSITP